MPKYDKVPLLCPQSIISHGHFLSAIFQLQRYATLKAQVVYGERHALRAFGFVVHVEHPHRFVLTFGQLLGLGREVLQEGWNIANDSLRATLCVRFRAEVVACGVLFLAARRKQVPMPESPPWWELFGVSRSQLGEVCTALLELYRLPKAQYIALGRDYTARAEDDAPTPAAPQPAASPSQQPVPVESPPHGVAPFTDATGSAAQQAPTDAPFANGQVRKSWNPVVTLSILPLYCHCC